MWCLFLALVAFALLTGCGSSPASQGLHPEAAAASRGTANVPAISVPDNPADREIRRQLHLAISNDDGLKSRDISFIVANGDVSVTGTVRTEEERKKINELAMNIGGVKSVANGLLIAE